MNKRIDKKKQKRTLESAVTATATSSAPATATPVVEIKEVVKEVKVPVEVPAKNPAFYVQYQSAEYTVAAITERVIADCNAKGHAVENPIITPVRKNTVSLTTNISNIKRILLLRFTVIIP